MHELSLCRHLLRTLEAQAEAHAFRRVHRVRVEAGPLAAVDPEALATAYRLASRGTLAEGSRLEFALRPAPGRCPACEGEHAVRAPLTPCPRCGAPLVVEGGSELLVTDLEVS